MKDESPLGPTVKLRGLCRMTPERAHRGYRLNRFLTGMRDPRQRAAFARDPDACMADYGLSPAEQDMVRRRDCDAMLDYGASNVAIGKASAALGLTLLGRGATGRGQSVQEFLAWRRAANEGAPWHF